MLPSNMDDLKRIFQLLMCLRKISALELSTSFKVTNVNKVYNNKDLLTTEVENGHFLSSLIHCDTHE